WRRHFGNKGRRALLAGGGFRPWRAFARHLDRPILGRLFCSLRLLTGLLILWHSGLQTYIPGALVRRNALSDKSNKSNTTLQHCATTNETFARRCGATA